MLLRLEGFLAYSAIAFLIFAGFSHYVFAEDEGTNNFLSTAESTGLFEFFTAAVQIANLLDPLTSGDFTVFAPTDDAFQSLPSDYVEGLFLGERTDRLVELLLYHVVPGTVLSTYLEDGMELPTLSPESLSISVIESRGVTLNDMATVTVADILMSNGVIHAIDQVLIPPSTTMDITFAELNPETNVADPSMAMEAEIDELVAGYMVDENEMDLPDIPTIAAESGDFELLVAALNATDLLEVLASPETEYTVFAPLDSAFQALPSDLLESLLTPEMSDTLADILLYHVVERKVLSSSLVDGTNVTTLQGEYLEITLVNETAVMINDVMVVTADILASNGVIHVIDGVMLPPSLSF